MLTNKQRCVQRHDRLRALTLAFTGAASLALTACGGGGGDNGSAPPAPAAALSVAAAASSALPSGNAVSVVATLTHGTGTPTWALTGPGSLSASTGGTVDYVPPSAEDVDAGATVTITATVGGLSQAVKIALQAVSVPGHRWQLARSPDVTWSEVDYANGSFVAVGNAGTVSSSIDAQTWNRQETSQFATWKSAAFGSAGWLVLGTNGELATSADAVTWSAAPALNSAVAGSMVNIVSGGHAYVAAGRSGSFASSDGVTWQAVAPKLEALAFGNGVFVGVCANVVFGSAPSIAVSSDGLTWPALPADCQQSQSAGDSAKLVFGDGVFVLADMSTSPPGIVTSTDGRTWTAVTSPPPLFDSWGLTFVNGLFHLPSAVGFQNGIASSADGSTWTVAPTQTPFLSSYASVAGNGSVVAAVLDGTLWTGPAVDHWTMVGPLAPGDLVSVDYGDGVYAAVSSGIFLNSVDGLTWSQGVWQQNSQQFNFTASVLKKRPGGVFVVGGQIEYDNPIMASESGAAFYSSADGINWQVAPPVANVSAGDAVVGLAIDTKGWVAVSADGMLYTSTDGVTFTNASTLGSPNARISDIAFGGTRHIVVGSGGYAAVSTDAVSWTTAATVMSNATPATPVQFRRIAYDGARFVAVCDGGLIATSADGLSWTVAASATTANLSAIAIASNGEIVATGTHGLTETSMDATHWTVRTAVTTRDLNAVAAVNGGFIAVGNDAAVAMSTH